MINCSAWRIELKSRLWNREKSSWKFGPSKWMSGDGMWSNQLSLASVSVRSALRFGSMPARKPPGLISSFPPMPPES